MNLPLSKVITNGRCGMSATDLDERIAGVFHACQDQVREWHLEWAKSLADGEELMRLARALAESDGCHEPDRITMGRPNEQVAYDVKRTIGIMGPFRPAWWHYLPEASAALKFMQAARSTISKPDTKTVVDFMAEIRRTVER